MNGTGQTKICPLPFNYVNFFSALTPLKEKREKNDAEHCLIVTMSIIYL